MATSDNISADANDQIRSLREQVDQLMSERVAPALEQAAAQAQDAARRARDYSSDQAEALSDQVRDRPLAAIAIAAVVGFALGRIAR